MPDITSVVSAQFPHPPLQFCGLEAIGTTHLAGDYIFTRPATLGGITLIPVDAFGFMWSVALTDIHDGDTFGIVDIFQERVAQIVIHHKMLSGELIPTTVVNANRDGFEMFSSPPEDVTVRVEIGYGLDFFWILLL